METVFLFPGQGAQFPGMAKDLYEHSSAVRELFQLASETVHKSMEKLLFEGTEEELKQTDNTQIAINLANLSARAVLAEFNITPTRSGGFSLGEYAALVNAGILTAEDAFQLVLHRGAIMEEVSRTLDDDTGRAGMSAAMGKDLPEIQDILSAAGINDVYPALYNSPAQTVIGGRAAALTAAATVLKDGGVRRVVQLKVSGPFHTPLMAPAEKRFSGIVGDIRFQEPTHPVYSNVGGVRINSGDEARDMCLKQLVTTVMWTSEERLILEESVAAAAGTQDAPLFLEVGPGSVLQGLWNAVGKTDDTWPTDRFRTAGTMEEIESLAKEIQNAH